MGMIGTYWRDLALTGIAKGATPSRTQKGVAFPIELPAVKWGAGGVRLGEGAVIGPERPAVSGWFPFEECSLD